ncbi:MAG: hypothetical protein C4518_04215 [Desulfobacteraceae bacterium]|nr:MAG: hypothetical protein C4518_04215 [Desulfobacteraceae bacterium]
MHSEGSEPPTGNLSALLEGSIKADVKFILVGGLAVAILRGHSLHVLNLKTLITLKRASNTPKHKQQIPVLEETLRQLEKG